jgi:alkylated DNA repair protein alkB homolog 8
MWRYHRPSSLKERTEHLYITNFGSNIDGCTLEVLKKSFPKSISAELNSNHSYVTFRDESEATNTKNRVKGVGVGTRRVGIFYAARSFVEEPDAPQPECTSLTKDVKVPGLVLVCDFVTEKEEKEILKAIDSGIWRSDIKARRVQHYGYTFDYKTRGVGTETCEFPKCIDRILMSKLSKISNFDQMTVNEYVPGKGIACHVDTHSAFEGPIVSVSLAASTVMMFKHFTDKTLHKTIELPRRSMMVMSGPARLWWEHGIAYRSNDVIDGVMRKRDTRVSLTFRKIRAKGRPCDCLNSKEFNRIEKSLRVGLEKSCT